VPGASTRREYPALRLCGALRIPRRISGSLARLTQIFCRSALRWPARSAHRRIVLKNTPKTPPSIKPSVSLVPILSSFPKQSPLFRKRLNTTARHNRRRRRKSQMQQDLPYHLRISQKRKHYKTRRTLRTTKGVDMKHPSQQLCPHYPALTARNARLELNTCQPGRLVPSPILCCIRCNSNIADH
jgi:hypothetical protein